MRRIEVLCLASFTPEAISLIFRRHPLPINYIVLNLDLQSSGSSRALENVGSTSRAT
jgi:hypothetical protein